VFRPNRLTFILILCCGAFSALPCYGQKWANDMFADREYDFGMVAKNADTVYKFEFKNLYKDDVVIRGVRSSCGCTTPSITSTVLKSHETAFVVAKYNSDRFVGSRSATITVMIDRPYPAEVQLKVTGFIRSDIVLQPGNLNFGSVSEGSQPQKVIQIDYRGGKSDWQIADVQSAYPNVRVSKKELFRSRDLVSYSLTARLLPGAEIGVNQAELILVTNDPGNRQISVNLEANIVSPIQITPIALDLGEVKPGQRVMKHVLVRSDQGCTIKEVDCPCSDVVVTKPVGQKKLHRIAVVFTAGSETGLITSTLRVVTDTGTVKNVKFSANIVPESPGINAIN